MELSDRENLAVSLLQRGLPLVERPFDEVGKSCGMTGREVVALVARLLALFVPTLTFLPRLGVRPGG